MAQFGSSDSYTSGNLSASQDPNGNAIISPSIAFGASPLGVAARTQTLYGIANANFDLTCADVGTAITVDNAIPYWSLETDGSITTTMVYNETTQNWSVRIDPTGAATGDSAILKTRTYLLNDDALALRQKAFASLTKQGTTGTAQWSIVLSATYFDEAGTQLSTYNIGTAADTGTWTGISGVTTSGSAAISSTAAYADIALTLTAAGSVSGTAKVDVNSVLIATSQSATGSFLITQTFTSSGTWTRPTGVEYVTVTALGGGGGGYSGNLSAQRTNINSLVGGTGGTSSPWLIHENLNIGTVASVAVGIGAGGAGGTAMTFTKAAAGTAISSQTGAAGALGGATTFGAFLSVGGGGTVTFTDSIYKAETMAGGFGGAGQSAPTNGDTGQTHRLAASYTAAPFTPAFITSSGTAGAGAATGGVTATGTAGGTSSAGTGIASGGAGAGGATVSVTSATQTASAGGQSNASGGAGGGGAASRITGTQTITVTGGAGGAASGVGYGGAGGGGGGVAVAGSTTNYNASTLTITSGAGGAGQSGFLTVAWIA